MTTIAQLMDRAYLEWLARADERPVEVEIEDNPLADNDESMVLAPTLTPEEINLLSAGTVCEFGDSTAWELIRTVDYDPSTRVLTARRGRLGTTARQWPQKTILTVAPAFSRQVVFDQIADAIVGLYPDLWKAATELAYTEPITEIETANVKGVLSVTDTDGFPIPYTFLLDFPDVDSGVAVRFDRQFCGQEVILKLALRSIRPTSSATDLSALNVDEAWVQIIMVTAVSTLLRGQEVDKTTLEFLTEALESSGLRLGEISDVATALLRYRELLVQKQKQALLADSPPGTVMARVI